MSITAKFPGTCTKCSKPITPGQTIEWRKGAGSHHVDCSSTASSATTATHRCAKCGKVCKAQYRLCYDCSPASAGSTYERGVGRVCDECGEKIVRGTRCWETGMMH